MTVLADALAHGVVGITAAVLASFATVGALPVVALLTAPATAVQVARRVPWVLFASVVFAELSVVVGLLVSRHPRLAAGAATATTAVAIFLMTLVVSEVRTFVGTPQVVRVTP